MSRLTRRVALHGRVVSSYDTDAAAYFSRMATDPGATRKGQINTLILALKTAGVWAKLDVLHLIAAHEASTALLNVKGTLYPLATTNSPSFTTDRGYQGDGTTSYLTVSGYNQSSPTAKLYVQDSASSGAYVNAHSTPTTASGNPVVGTTGADGGPRIIPFSAANTSVGRLNGSGSNVTFTTGTATNLGFAAVSRVDNANISLYRGSTGFTAANSSQAIAATAVYLLNQSSVLFSTARVAASFVGSGLTSVEMADFYNALNTYLTAIGAN